MNDTIRMIILDLITNIPKTNTKINSYEKKNKKQL